MAGIRQTTVSSRQSRHNGIAISERPQEKRQQTKAIAKTDHWFPIPIRDDAKVLPIGDSPSAATSQGGKREAIDESKAQDIRERGITWESRGNHGESRGNHGDRGITGESRGQGTSVRRQLVFPLAKIRISR